MSRLRSGQEAPLFAVQTLDGSAFDLKAARGKKLWVAFFRYARCPLCNLYLNFVISKLPQLKAKGVETVAIFESETSRFPKFIGGQASPPIRLIPDPEKKLYSKYGLECNLPSLFHPKALLSLVEALARGFRQPVPDGELGQLPAHFLIDEAGVLRDTYYGANPADNIPWERVEAFAAITRP